jgi:AcrR family transcriptional regulator
MATVCDSAATYTSCVPRLWSQTIEAHRREVREAILDATAALVAAGGLNAVTMSQIAGQAGVARATLYKYFPDVGAVLLAWHERHLDGHLRQLVEMRDQAGDAWQRLGAVLETFAVISHQSRGHHDAEVTALLHQPERVHRARQHLHDLVRDVLIEAVASGHVRDDTAPDELATYCLHALGAAGRLPSEAAVHRLVTLTLAGLHRPR